MNSVIVTPNTCDERHVVLQALESGEMTELISLGTVDEAMTFLKKRYFIE
jgi:hypothetical protein